MKPARSIRPVGSCAWISPPGAHTTKPDGSYTNTSGLTRDIAISCVWSESDLATLERAGFLEKTGAWRNPDDTFDIRINYRVRHVRGE